MKLKKLFVLLYLNSLKVVTPAARGIIIKILEVKMMLEVVLQKLSLFFYLQQKISVVCGLRVSVMMKIASYLFLRVFTAASGFGMLLFQKPHLHF